MSALAATGSGLILAVAVATANAVTGGPDLIGIAAVITAVSGLLGTLVMAYLALRRRDDTPITAEGIADAVRDGLQREAGHGDPDTP